MPSARSWRNASSRFGPTEPWVLAWLSVWQLPHLATNSTFPCTRLVVGCLTAHPPTTNSTSAAGRTATRFRRPLSNIERGTLSEPGDPMPRRWSVGGAGSMAADEDAPEVPDADALHRPRGHRRSRTRPDLLRSGNGRGARGRRGAAAGRAHPLGAPLGG